MINYYIQIGDFDAIAKNEYLMPAASQALLLKINEVATDTHAKQKQVEDAEILFNFKTSDYGVSSLYDWHMKKYNKK